MGFTAVDRTGASTYTGQGQAGSQYTPQFILQSHISSDNWQEAADASVNKTASGRVEVIKFGIVKYVQFQIKFATNIAQPPNFGPIRHNPNGVENLQTFMRYIIQRAPFEYMPDEDAPSTFQTIVLESDPESSTGTGYKLKELYDKNLPGYFETSVLKCRLVEES